MSKSSLSGEEARKTVGEFLRAARIRIVAIGEREAELALEAFERFGKRRHPANLNMGDCFATACAKSYAARLLFIGDDFTHTDVNLAEDQASRAPTWLETRVRFRPRGRASRRSRA